MESTKTGETNPIDDLLQMWKDDAKIDRTDPGAELTKIGSLHSKYLTLLSMNRQSLKAAERNIKRMKRIKWEYYNGKLDQDLLKKYNLTPFPHILKSDINIYMESDTDMLKMTKIKEVHEEIVDICESILKELNSRTYQLRDIITWERFTQGV